MSNTPPNITIGVKKVLNLSYLKLGAEGAKRLASELETNKTLVELDLFGTGIGDEGAIAIAKALEKNVTLQKINLSSNKIGDEGLIAIAKAMEVNNTLKELSFSFNLVSDEGAKALVKALEVNTGLEKLEFDLDLLKFNAPIPQEYIDKIQSTKEMLKYLRAVGKLRKEQGKEREWYPPFEDVKTVMEPEIIPPAEKQVVIKGPEKRRTSDWRIVNPIIFVTALAWIRLTLMQ